MRSESGPQNSCPPAYPTRNRLKVSCTLSVLVPKTSVIVGSVGRLMSTARAVTPASAPSRKVSPQDAGFFINGRMDLGILEAQDRAVVVVGKELGVARTVD